MQNLNKIYHKMNLVIFYCSVLLGVTVILASFYIRFLRERFPQEIPFILTEFRFYILLFICIGYIYRIKVLLKPTSSEVINQILKYLKLPISDLLMLFKYNKYTLKYLNKILKLFPEKFSTQMYAFLLSYVFPRLLLVLFFMLDLFYFNKLYYFYELIALGVFFWGYNLHKSMMFHMKELAIAYLEESYKNVMILEKGWDDPLNYYEYEEGYITNTPLEIQWKPNYRNKYHDEIVSIREYIQILLEKTIDEAENNYDLFTDEGYGKDYYDFHACPMPKEFLFQHYTEATGKTELDDNDYIILRKEFNNIVPLINNLSFHLHYLPNMEKKYYMQKVILIICLLWLISWIYILIKSFHTLQAIPVTLRILEVLTRFIEIYNPFINP